VKQFHADKPISAFLQYGRPMDQAQVGLQGLSIPGITSKPLLANSAEDRPSRRTDGFDRTGPYGAQRVPVKASAGGKSQPLPPPRAP